MYTVSEASLSSLLNVGIFIMQRRQYLVLHNNLHILLYTTLKKGTVDFK